MKTTCSAILFLLLNALTAQNSIVYAEWFFDEDPGFGKATPFSASSAGNEIELNETISLGDLTPGVHLWYARVLNAQGVWSLTMYREFLVIKQESSNSITRAEWFWDTDPGFGRANQVRGDGDPYEATWTVEVTGLQPGVHTLYMRVQNVDGVWSHTIHSSTIICAAPEELIAQIKYYYKDGDSQSQTIVYQLEQPQSVVDLTFIPNTAELIEGQTYEMCFTVLRTDGVESEERCETFVWNEPETEIFVPETVSILGGEFIMGCTSEQMPDCEPDESPAHQVKIPNFQMGKYEVTQKEWNSLMRTNPSQFENCGEDCPVEQVDFNDVITYCNRLSIEEGLTPCYYFDENHTQVFDSLTGFNGIQIPVYWLKTADGYRLPTEAEWEFAARGGTSSNGFKFSGSNNIEEVSWYLGNAGSTTHPVGQKSPNELSLFDMSGNIWEWCWDLYSEDYYAMSESCIPLGPVDGDFHTLRGGSWVTDEPFSRISNRFDGVPPIALSNYGFRIARGALNLSSCGDNTSCDNSRDSIRLIAFMAGTNFSSWYRPWRTTQSLQDWPGLTFNEEGCIEGINSDQNNIIGTMSSSLFLMEELKTLSLTENQITGTIPTNIDDGSLLSSVLLASNALTGEIPASLQNLSNLTNFNISNNQFATNIPLFFAVLDSLAIIDISRNQFTFSHLVDTRAAIQAKTESNNGRYSYAPQDSVFENTLIQARLDTTITIDLGIDENLASNIYTWYKDGDLKTIINGENKLSIGPITEADEGEYWCHITNPNASELTLFSRRIEIVLDASEISVSVAKEDVSCNGAQDGNIDLTVSGGTESYLFSWDYQNETTEDLSNLGPGIYQVTITDQGTGLSTTQLVNIQEPQALQITTNSRDASCFNGQDGNITILARGGSGQYTYNWSNDLPSSSSQSNLVAGTYFLTLSDANNCFLVDSARINHPPDFTINAQSSPATCPGQADGAIDLLVTGGSGNGFTFLWSDGSTEANRSNLVSGEYIISVTDNGNCTKEENIRVEVQESICEDCAPMSINPPISNGDQTICGDDSLPLLSVTAEENQTVNWYDASEDGILLAESMLQFQPEAPGTYFAATVLITNRCISQIRTPITIQLKTTPTIQEWQKICDPETQTAIIFLKIDGADELSHSLGNLRSGDEANTYFIEGIPIGEEVSIFAANNNGCSTELDVSGDCCIVDPPLIEMDRLVLCLNNYEPAIFQAQVPNGYTVFWYDQAKGGLPLLRNSLNFTTNTQGIYYAETRKIDDPSCFSDKRTRVRLGFVPDDNPAINEYKKFCSEDGASYTVELSIQRAQEIFSNQNPIQLLDSTNYRITNIPIEKTLEVQALNIKSGCEAELSTNAPSCDCSTLPLPIPTFDYLDYCKGASLPILEVTVEEGYSAAWFDQPDKGRRLASNTLTFQPRRPGYYYVETIVPGQPPCPNTGRSLIIVEELPISITDTIIQTCNIFQVGKTEIDTLQNWLGCDSLFQRFFILQDSLPIMDSLQMVCNPSEVGEELIILEDPLGCSMIIKRRSELSNPEDELQLQEDLFEIAPCERKEFLNLLENDLVPNNYTFEFLNLLPDNLIELQEIQGRYTGIINFNAPCKPQNITLEYIVCRPDCPPGWCDTTSVTFNIDCDIEVEDNFFKIITPNGDGKNDEFDPLEVFFEAGCPIAPEEVQLIIAHRQGEVVFRTQDVYSPWNGKGSNGEDLPNGTYFFLLEIEGDEKVYKGYVDLVR